MFRNVNHLQNVCMAWLHKTRIHQNRGSQSSEDRLEYVIGPYTRTSRATLHRPSGARAGRWTFTRAKGVQAPLALHAVRDLRLRPPSRFRSLPDLWRGKCRLVRSRCTLRECVVLTDQQSRQRVRQQPSREFNQSARRTFKRAVEGWRAGRPFDWFG